MLLRVIWFIMTSGVNVSATLVKSAFAWCDYNSGIADNYHAAKCLHNLMDVAAAEQNLEYSEVIKEILAEEEQNPLTAGGISDTK